MDNSVAFIINGGRKSTVKKSKELIEYLKTKDFKYIVKFTEYKQHAVTLTKELIALGYKTIVACGGDGTVNEVTNGIVSSGEEVALSIIPLGRGNDTHWGFDLEKDLKKAVDKLAFPKTKKIDLVLYKDISRYFINICGIGLEAHINETASQMKHIQGFLSYALGFVKILINNIKPYDVDLTIDDKTVASKAQVIALCNGRREGGAFLLAPEAVNDDGYLDLVYTNGYFKNFSLLSLAISFFSGKHTNGKAVTCTKCKTLKVVSKKPEMIIEVDGELCNTSSLACTFEIKEKILSLVI